MDKILSTKELTMENELLEGLRRIWDQANELMKKPFFDLNGFSEAVTKDVIIKKVLELLGWWIEKGEIFMEFPVPSDKGTLSIDYALILNGEPKVIVECKSLKTKLTDKESMQVMKYAFYSGITWGILTNGQIWIVSNSEYREEFFRFDLSKPEKSISNIKLLTRESLEAGELQDNFEDEYTAQIINRFLNENKDRLVDEIRKKDNKLRTETIARLWGKIKITTEKEPSVITRTTEEVTAKSKLIFPIDIYGTYKGQRFKAKLQQNRKILYEGKEHNSPESAAKSICDTTANSWDFWKLAYNYEKIITIRDLVTGTHILNNEMLNENSLRITKIIENSLKEKDPQITTKKFGKWHIGIGRYVICQERWIWLLLFTFWKKNINNLYINFPYKKFNEPNNLIQNGSSYIWRAATSWAQLETPEHAKAILPEIKAAYEYFRSKYSLSEDE